MRQRDKPSGHKWPRKSHIYVSNTIMVLFNSYGASTSHFVTVTNLPRKQKTTFNVYKLLIKGSCRVKTDKESLK